MGAGSDPSAAGRAMPQQAAEGAPEAEVTFEKLVYGGSGLARLDRRVILAPFVLPGETARIAIAGERSGLAEGTMKAIVTPAAQRVDPACPFFYRCGGCHYQHAAYQLQLEQKRAILAETLQRIGKFAPPADIPVVSGEPWGYRNRTQFHLDDGRIGYFGLGTHALVSVDRCPISSKKINQTLAALREMVRDRRWPRFVRSVELFTDESAVQLFVRETEQPVARRFFEWCAEQMPGYAPGAIDYAVGTERYRVSRGSFFQVNRYLVGPLVDLALDGSEGETALDLYSGAGLFTLPLARRFKHVAAVESGSGAVRDLEHNVREAGLKVRVHRAATEAYLEALDTPPDFVLADPPRAGLGKSAVRSLLRVKPRRIHIVSCDPATLARDLAALIGGGYRLDKLTLIDLFPQTFHIESVAVLTL
ncbi:MAG TPA: class I SAM-dependent RNA methyltransferase [Bryobacteraceae bacterium]|nr:class I SAM-dependent RNA methyltransferase [Bryobacteraceae bacterium]